MVKNRTAGWAGVALGRGIGEGIRVAVVDGLVTADTVGAGVGVSVVPGKPVTTGVSVVATVMEGACPVHSALAVNGRGVAGAAV